MRHYPPLARDPGGPHPVGGLAVLTDGIRAGIDELLAAATAQPTDEVVVELRAVRAAKGLPAPV